MALSSQQWSLLRELLEVAEKSDRGSFLGRMRAHFDRRPRERRIFAQLIEELVSVDSDLSEVAPTIGTILRSRIAAENVRATFSSETLDEDLDDSLSADDVLRIGRVRGQAEAAILETPMLTAAEVGRVLGSKSKNPREFARGLRERGDVVALRSGSRYLFPAFQFCEARHEVWPIAAEVNRALGAHDDPWGVASFWLTRDGYLDSSPADLVEVRARADDIRKAAAREMAPVG